jgi:hypothetical protein
MVFEECGREWWYVHATVPEDCAGWYTGAGIV